MSIFINKKTQLINVGIEIVFEMFIQYLLSTEYC